MQIAEHDTVNEILNSDELFPPMNMSRAWSHDLLDKYLYVLQSLYKYTINLKFLKNIDYLGFVLVVGK